jgi:hypothetical protein
MDISPDSSKIKNNGITTSSAVALPYENLKSFLKVLVSCETAGVTRIIAKKTITKSFMFFIVAFFLVNNQFIKTP